MQKIYPADLPTPRGHYSPAIVHQGTVYVSGQLPLDPDGQRRAESIEEQTERCLLNVRHILQAAGSDLDQALKMCIFVSDIGLWPQVNATFARVMGEHRPARIVVPSGPLNYGCLVEIDCIAALPG